MTRDHARRPPRHATDHADAAAPAPGRITRELPAGVAGGARAGITVGARPSTALGGPLDSQLLTLVAHLQHNAALCARPADRDTALAAIDTRVDAALRHVPDEQRDQFRDAVLDALDDTTLDALIDAIAESRGPGARARDGLGIEVPAATTGLGAGGAMSAQVQLDAGSARRPDDEVTAIARAGVASGGGALPHLATIQRAFGHHDVSGVAAHVGGNAGEAAQAMGARAYAVGDAVAFGGAPDLHTAAHEAAHVVQQRGGVRFAGGVGRAGDPYEQHADAVADSVVRGDSAEALLDTMAHRGAAGGAAVQMLTELADGAAASRLRALIHASTAADLATIRAALAAALASVSLLQIRVGVGMTLAGERYQLELAVADARRLQFEAATARPARAGDAVLLGALPEDVAPTHTEHTIEAGSEFLDTGLVATPGMGQVRIRAGVVGELEVSPTAPAEEPHGIVSGAESSLGGGRERDHHGHWGWTGAETGMLRDWLLPQCTAVADHLQFRVEGGRIELAAGLETGTVHIGPFDFHMSIDLIDVEAGRGRRPHFTPPSITLHSEVALAQLAEHLPPAIAARVGHSRATMQLQWVPPWQTILRELGLLAVDDAALAAAAPIGVDVYAASVAAGGASTGAIAAAAALPVLAGALIVGGTLVACAAASEEGTREGHLTWYVHEYAAQLADACFQNHEGHAHGAHGEASRFAGMGRSDARETAHALGPDQRDALRLHYRTHQALAQAVGRILADRLEMHLFDAYVLR